MSDVEIFEVTDARALALDEDYEAVRQLFDRAFDGEWLPDSKDAFAWVLEHLGDDELEVLVAFDGDAWKGMAIVSAYVDAFSPYPWVTHFYSDKNNRVRKALVKAIAKWCSDRGFERVAALNITGIEDATYMRSLKIAGTGHVRGSYFVVDLDEGGK